jgi:hypothetical protein
MSWPAKEETQDTIDWSSWQQNANGSWIDVDAFMAQNPNIKNVILRACLVNGAPDRSYAHYFDAFRKHDVKIIAYLWPNPIRADIQDRWCVAIGDRIPDAIMLDFELTFYQTDEVLTDNAEQSFKDAEIFELPVIGYTRGEWWTTHIKRTIEIGKLFIIAHYVFFMLDGKWQQCRNHADLHKHLPISNNFTPYLGRIKRTQVLGWQVSCKARLAPYLKDMDLDSLIKAAIDKLLGDHTIDPLPEKLPIQISYPAGRVELTEVEV